MDTRQRHLAASVAFAALLLGPSAAHAVIAVPPPLGTVQSFAVLGASAVTGQAGGGAVINGDLGSSPNSGPAISNFPPSLVSPPFFLHLTNDAVVQQAQIDATAASVNLLGQGPGTALPAQLGATVVGPGVYTFSSAADIASNTTLTLSGAGVYIFLVGSSITANVLSNVVLQNVDPCNVFWRVQDSATLSGLNFPGTVIAGTSITVGDNGVLTGRAIALSGAVTMSGDGGTIIGGCSGTAGTPPPAAPTLSKAFSPATIDLNGTSTLTLTLSNPNASVATLTADLVDTLPTNVVIAGTPNASTTCGGGTTVTAVAAGSTVTLVAGRSIPAGTSTTPGTCTVTVDVTSATAGSYVNTLAAGALMTSNGNNANSAIATLTVNPALVMGAVAPTVGKSFNPVTINAGETSTITIILSNPSTDTADTITTLTDTLPTGLVIATPNGASTTCAGGMVTAVAGTGSIVLTGGTIPFSSMMNVAGTCTVTADVTSAAGGSYLNTIPAGGLITNNGNNANPISVTLTVTPVAPTVTKLFAPNAISTGDLHLSVSSLTITLSNPNTTPATNAAVLDALPSGMVIATPPNTNNTCGGTLTATAGTGIIQLTGGTIPAGSGTAAGTCVVTVNVTTNGAGSFVNTLPVNALQTDNGNNTVPAAATLSAASVPAPTLSGWALMMLTGLLALVGFAAVRRQTM